MKRSMLWVPVALTLFAAALASARNVERIESIGVVPVKGAPTPGLRDAAVRVALADAVQRVALSLLEPPEPPDGADPDRDSDAMRLVLSEVLGSDPLAFVTRFQTIEDRGVRPTLFSAESGAENEYLVVVAVDVDRDRVRDRLGAAGLELVPSGDGPRLQLRLALEGVADHRAYEAIRTALLGELGARSATLVEAQQGHLVLQVDASGSSELLLSRLQRALSPGLRLIPVSIDDAALTVQVEALAPSQEAPGGAQFSDADAIDTQDRNRY